MPNFEKQLQYTAIVMTNFIISYLFNFTKHLQIDHRRYSYPWNFCWCYSRTYLHKDESFTILYFASLNCCKCYCYLLRFHSISIFVFHLKFLALLLLELSQIIKINFSVFSNFHLKVKSCDIYYYYEKFKAKVFRKLYCWQKDH